MWYLAIVIPFCLVIGFLAGWILAIKYCRKQMTDNPPISEHQIRELYRQAGRTLSEKQMLQIMNNLRRNG
ncbi:YneF family protein [Candidatus Mycoplasma haematobovis]|uniref:YneF family protein n=1 Tax=Candidatus Mycoplasma haematobovis TaxID=432608 RepID=UPI0016508768|nr:YneF family protein [Candidatus Mycoplasma haematobovis]